MVPMFQDDGSSSVTSSPLQFFSMNSLSPTLGIASPYPWLKELKSEERGLYLIHLMITCANHVSTGSLENANLALDQITHLASPHGDTMQRIASYFTEALADRILKSWPGLHKALNFTTSSLVSEEIFVKKLFFEMLPFMKVAFVLTNQAILESMEGEKIVHIIDLNGSESSSQWIALFQALNSRPGGPPFLRITCVHQHKEVLEQMGHVLIDEAEKLDIPFQFNPVVSKLESLDIEKLHVKTGEALAVSSILQLHTLLAFDDEISLKNIDSVHSTQMSRMTGNTLEELLEKDKCNGHSISANSTTSSLRSSTSSSMNNFLNSLWNLSPKIMVLTEQDSNHNGSTLMERLLEALYTYAALFDCLESTTAAGPPMRTSERRMKVEKMVLGEEIKNIVSCEGVERKERHEKLEKWVRRLDMAGYGNVGLSYYGVLQARRLVHGIGCDGVRINEVNGCAVICWEDRPLYSVSAWKCRK